MFEELAENEFLTLLIVNDCLRILKTLIRSNPLEPVFMGLDNLWLDKNGRVKLSDPFLSRLRIKQEITQLRMKMAKSENVQNSGVFRQHTQPERLKRKQKGFP